MIIESVFETNTLDIRNIQYILDMRTRYGCRKAKKSPIPYLIPEAKIKKYRNVPSFMSENGDSKGT